jgi:predicted Fe-Mo cluster-binding NifX family protein
LSNGKSLGSGGFKPSGSITNIVVVVLVVVVLILCAGVFMLYNQEKGANNDATAAKQAYKTLNDTYNELSGKYSALVASNADLNERYDLLDTEYKNVSTDYNSLKNQSDSTTVKIGEFLESEPTVAYSYSIASDIGANNTTVLGLKVNVYNVCKSDVSNVVVKVTIKSITDDTTGELVKTISSIPSLGSRVVEWELDNTSRVQSVWVTLA